MGYAIEVTGRSADTNADGSSGSISRPWVVYNSPTEADAISSVAFAAPSLINGLFLVNITVDEAITNGYQCTAEYGVFKPRTPPAVGESQFNFEVATQTQRVVFPIGSQVVYTRDGESAPGDSDQWLIGQQADGSAPEGVDVFEPTASFSETHWMPASVITPGYQRAAMKIVGKTNSAVFRGWAAGEALCTGVSGSRRGDDDWEISFRFSIRENQADLTIAGISVAEKKGWEYIWPRYELKVDADEPLLSNVVKYIVKAQVIQATSFTALGI